MKLLSNTDHGVNYDNKHIGLERIILAPALLKTWQHRSKYKKKS